MRLRIAQSSWQLPEEYCSNEHDSEWTIDRRDGSLCVPVVRPRFATYGGGVYRSRIYVYPYDLEFISVWDGGNPLPLDASSVPALRKSLLTALANAENEKALKTLEDL